MEIVVLDSPVGNAIARGSYYGGPDYEFIIGPDGHIYFQVVGDTGLVWAGRDAESFRLIAEAWNRFQSEVVDLSSEATRSVRIEQMRQEMKKLGAIPEDLPPDPEPLWSLFIFEAENDLS